MTEAEIQRAVVQHLSQRGASGLFYFHPANGGWRLKVEAKILKGLGVIPGVPDLILIHEGRAYGLELKTRNGRQTAEQEVAIARMENAGAVCCTAYGIDEALKALESWGLLRGKVQ